MADCFRWSRRSTTLMVMFGDPAADGRDGRAAVAHRRAVSLPVHPLLHLDAGRTARSASRSSSRSWSSGSTRSFSARCAWSRASRASRTSSSATRAPATTTMNARIALTWQQSLFSVVVSAITILGTGAGGRRRRHARDARPDDGRRSDGGHRLPRRGLRAAVGDRAHAPASCRARSPAPSACARCSRCCRRRSDAPDAIDASRIVGRHPVRGRRLRLPGRHAACCTTSPSRPSRARWSRWSA